MIKCGTKILRLIMPGSLQNTILYANVKLLQTSHTFYITNTTSFFVVHKEAIVRILMQINCFQSDGRGLFTFFHPSSAKPKVQQMDFFS